MPEDKKSIDLVHEMLKSKEARILADKSFKDNETLRDAHLLVVRTGMHCCNGGRNDPLSASAAIGAQSNLLSEMGLSAKSQHHKFCDEYRKDKGLDLPPATSTFSFNTKEGIKATGPAAKWITVAVSVLVLLWLYQYQLNKSVTSSVTRAVMSAEKTKE